MACLLPCIAVFLPRFAMVLIFLFTNWFGIAYQTLIWPLLGFIFMPYTTLAYMAAMLNNNRLDGGWLVLLIIAVFFDLGGQGRSARPVYYRRY